MMGKDKKISVEASFSLTAEQFKPLLRDALEDEDMLVWLRKLLCEGCGGNSADLEAKLKEVQMERDALRREVGEINQACEDNLRRVQGQINQAEAACAKVQAELDAHRQQGRLPEGLARVLARVRWDSALAGQFQLNTQAEEMDVLLSLVAILGHDDGFKKLWDFYKNRCENQKVALDAEDVHVLEVALAWLNANWPDKPYVFSSPAPGDRYDYDKHLRPPGMSGEQVTATWLPGLPELRIKPLVVTR
jgi:hypothetical protein